MKLLERLQSIISSFKSENPLTKKFMLWYIVAFIVTIILIVASQILPMIQDTIQLNQDIQAGKVYISGQNPILTPSIEDFILQNDGTLQMEKLYPLRLPQEHWSPSELQQYWDNIDQKKLEELKRENRQMLEQQLRDLP